MLQSWVFTIASIFGQIEHPLPGLNSTDAALSGAEKIGRRAWHGEGGSRIDLGGSKAMWVPQ